MTSCPSCGTPNTDGARFCVKCGTTLSTAPAPEMWRAPSGDLNQTVADQTSSSTGGYAPPSATPPSYPAYTPPQNMSYQQMGGGGTDWQALGASKKMPAGICGILLGGLGIHKFLLGYSTEGIIMLVVSLVGGFLTCGLGSIAVGIIGLVEGIIYLTKTDEEFVRTYVQNKKGWF
ncbi:MAG: TM2 domain-containing protein [Acidobacteria bacterium]|nr:TM2 domain-containing protein [Acidobacteriota bacterium]